MEQLRREEELIQEEELEAEALAEVGEDGVKKVGPPSLSGVESSIADYVHLVWVYLLASSSSLINESDSIKSLAKDDMGKQILNPRSLTACLKAVYKFDDYRSEEFQTYDTKTA